MVKLRSQDLRELRLPLPPIDEQRWLVRDLLAARDRNAVAVAAIDRQIALLRERRLALVTAVVSGEMQVPGTETANAVA